MNNCLLPVSVVILTNRENALFKKCLEAVTWATEVLVMTDGISLKSSQLMDQPRVQVHQLQHRLTDFSVARNEALSLVTQPWVLFVDSDEVVTPESVPLIEDALRGTSDGYRIKRTDVFQGQQLKFGETGGQRLLRLARTSQVTFERPVHEVAVVNGKVSDTQIELIHDAHTTVSEFLAAVGKYAQSEAKYRHQQGRGFTWARLLLYPTGKFLSNYVLKLGFLDGRAGLTYAVMMSLHSLLVSVFLYEYALQK